MMHVSRILTNSRKLFCALILIMIAWQQWSTFLFHQQKFKDPIQFTKEHYRKDDISQYENRFHEIKNFFTKPTRITYIGEDYVSTNGIREYHFALTQYYLAPNLLFRTDIMHDKVGENSGLGEFIPSPIVYDTVLFNLYSSMHINPATNYFTNNGWHVLKDFDNGLVLLIK